MTICRRCGKNAAVEGKTRCKRCAEAENARQVAARAARPAATCSRCLKRQADAGYAKCKPCREEMASQMRQWRANNTVKSRRYQKDRRRAQRQRILDAYGGLCSCCGESAYEFLGIDHVTGGGTRERITLTRYGMLKKIIDSGFPPEYRILCHNCNSSLGFYGYCPHQQQE